MTMQRVVIPGVLLACGCLPWAGCAGGANPSRAAAPESRQETSGKKQQDDYIETVVAAYRQGTLTEEQRQEFLNKWVRPAVFQRRKNTPARLSDRFPNHELTTHEGKKVKFYDDIIKDRIVIVYFMYTTCDGI